jgi:hypothetical protein
MKLITKLTIENKLADIPWPEEIPAPMVGDKVVMLIGKETHAFTIRSRLYSIGIDPKNGSPLTVMCLTGSPA